MTLSAGSRLGPYEIVSPLGAGGMGEVYRARDTRLDRTVAIKVLAAHLSSSPEVRQRFEREAKTISQLSHPHICALHDVGREGDVEYLVMEYLEGETLAERLTKGPLPREQTLRYGIQIADALDKAHRQGIVHRDLKPGNVMLTKSGVKLLDFGLAKTFERSLDATGREQTAAAQHPMAGRNLTALPTALTQEGTILGTFQYMAPEQLEAKDADARTDIFAFGCVLYEMATGKKAFSGATQASLISSILRDDPQPISQVQPMSPPALDHVVQKSLAKDPEDRWQNAADLGGELKWIAEGGSQTGVPVPMVSRRRSRERLGWIVAAVLLAATIGLTARLFSRPAPTASVFRASILPPEDSEFVSTWIDAGPVEISPDGERIVFTARKGENPNLLWVRKLSEPNARPLAGTEGAQRPFWSPDGQHIGFFADRFFKKIDVDGGPVLTLAPGTESRGGTWNRDGVILFTPGARGPVQRVSANGGKVTEATVYGPTDATHRYPHFLPDGRHFLYLVRHGSGAGRGRDPEIRVGSLDSKESKLVLNVASNVAYASGHLLYVREGALVAQEFDLDRLAVKGEPVTLVPDVLMDERFSRGVFSTSSNGVLAYQTGKGQTLSALRWLDRNGAILETVGEPALFFNGGDPEISPDGKRATASIVDLRTGQTDIWMIDLATGTRRRFTTGAGSKEWCAWSPDGGRVAHSISNPRGTGYDVVLKSIGGSEPEVMLVSDPVEFQAPLDFSPDGSFLLYSKRKDERDDLWLLPLTADRKPRPFLATPALEPIARFSANGRYVAYQSDETGRFEIYVATFPGQGGRWQISQNGGVEPRWSRDGKELFYFAPDNRLMAAQMNTDGTSIDVGVIHPLFQARALGFTYRYDVANDGKRFLVVGGLPQDLSPITILTNWTAELPKK
ncbi:MAG TPA: protein kinase [Thermoanaerobaculia bacterium]|jgi:serine/threonine protein kinase|nr:protein kinase [Thermoanaerobaculia bacterium]